MRERRDLHRLASRTLFAAFPVLLAGLLTLFLAGGCARVRVREEALERFERGELAPGGIVFVVHGMLRDLGYPWDYALRDEISACACDDEPGRVAAIVTYSGGPLGVWLNHSCRAPGALLARIADRGEELHQATGCPAPFSIRVLGFSLGTEVVLEAAGRMRSARIERAVLWGPSCFAFSSEARDLVRSGRIGRIVCRWSPFDLVTILAPLGAGTAGFHPEEPGIENRSGWRFHLPPLFAAGRRMAIEDLFDGEPPPAGHTCGESPEYLHALAELLREGSTPSE